MDVQVSSVRYLETTYNQPILCPSATWNPDAITFANSSTIGTNPSGLFVSRNNTVYFSASAFNNVQVWVEGGTGAVRTMSAGLGFPRSVFLTLNGDIYIANDIGSGSVELWTPTATSGVPAMIATGSCIDLFVDSQDSLYCSPLNQHRVLRRSLATSVNTTKMVAGSGTPGSSSTLLNYQAGIFVDRALQLYVADCGNNRVQRFVYGELNGITVAGNGLMGAITLDCPAGIVLDGNGYLFITDSHNNRVIGSGPGGFRCILGCSGGNGSSASELFRPEGLKFDSHGNLFVVDHLNNRIQKFLYQPSLCGSYPP